MTSPITTPENTHLLTPDITPYPGKRSADLCFAGFPVQPVESNNALTQRALEVNTCQFCHDLGRDIRQVTVEQNSILCGSCTKRFTDDPTMRLDGNKRLGMPIVLRNNEQLLNEVVIHCPYHTDCPETLKFGKLREFVEREDRKITKAGQEMEEFLRSLGVDYGEERLFSYRERDELESKPHLKEHLYQCQWRMQRCRYCKEVMPREHFLTTHKTHCPKLNTKIDDRTLTAVTCDRCGDTYFNRHWQKQTMRHQSLCLPQHTPVRLEDIENLPPETQADLITDYRRLVEYLGANLEILSHAFAEERNSWAAEKAAEKQAAARHNDDLNHKVIRQTALTEQTRSALNSTERTLDSTKTELQKYQACDARHRLIRQLKRQPKPKEIQPGTLTDQERERLEVIKKNDLLKPKHLVQQLENTYYDSSDTILPQTGCTFIHTQRNPNVFTIHIPDVNALPEQIGTVLVQGTFNGININVTVIKTDDDKAKFGLCVPANGKVEAGDSISGQCHYYVFTAHPLYCTKGHLEMTDFPVISCDSPPQYRRTKATFAIPQTGLNGSTIPGDMLIHLQFTDIQPVGQKESPAPVNQPLKRK